MFHSARLTLTAWYLLIIMLISISFSVVIYTVLTREVERIVRIQRLRIERRLHGDELLPAIALLDPDLVNETNKRLALILIAINGVIIIASGGLGYILAGRTLRPIQDMVSEQHRFISDSSHELRTPLTSLKSAMEVSLRDKEFTIGEAKTLIAESIREVDKLQLLSDGMLQLAQYQTPNNHPSFGIVSTKSIILESIRKVEPIAKQKHVTISQSGKNINIKGNKYGLVDLLIILLDNAIKYSPRASKIHISTQSTDNSIIVSVKDEGIGINKGDIPHIFDRFYRADTARSKNAAVGYGLGLSIAKKIADTHNGTIHVVSSIGKGSTFTVRLPA